MKKNTTSIEDVEADVNRFERTKNMTFKIAYPFSHNKKPYPPWWEEQLKNLRELTRHTFNECYISKQWQPYKDCLKVYKKAIRTAKKEGCRNFCESLNSVKDTARLGRRSKSVKLSQKICRGLHKLYRKIPRGTDENLLSR